MESTLTYKLETFEGPLDLLLSLIQKNKVSITDIPISLICDQYIEYITQAQKLDMELASEFIVMASELMLIKSKMLLPKEEEVRTHAPPLPMPSCAISKQRRRRQSFYLCTPFTADEWLRIPTRSRLIKPLLPIRT